MHLYLITRGPKYISDMWQANMQSQFSCWKRKNLKTGMDETSKVQWNLKPIQLWEVVAPEEAIPEIMAYNHIPSGDEKQCHGEAIEKLAMMFRLGLKLDKMPKYDKNTLKVQANRLIY